MPDVRSFGNRLKLKEEAARMLAVMDLKRVSEVDRDAATQVLVGHLARESSQAVRHRILEVLLLWKRTDIAPALRELATAPDPALASDAAEALSYLDSMT